MSDNPQRVLESNQVKARLRLLRGKYKREAESQIAKYVHSQKNPNELISVDQARKILIKVYNNRNYNNHSIDELNKACDELGIPKQDTEVFDGIMQGLKEAKEFMQGKDNGSTIYNKEGKELKGQEAVDYYQALKKAKGE